MNLKGNQVNYRPLQVDDAASFHRWCSNKDVVRYSLSWFQTPRSRQDFVNWLGAIIESDNSFTLGVCHSHSNKLIGYAGIADISAFNRSGEYFILIGESEYWGNGIGTEVTRTITDYGFNKLGLHRVFLTVSELNKGAVRAYENAGYIPEGILRDAAFRDGRFHDKVVMSVLSHE